TVRVLAVELDPAVLESPARRTGGQLAVETVLCPQPIMRKRLVVEQAAEAIAELVVLLIGNLQQPLLHPEGIAVVVSGLEPGDLRGPAAQVVPVEQTEPLATGSLDLHFGLRRAGSQRGADRNRDPGSNGAHQRSRTALTPRPAPTWPGVFTAGRANGLPQARNGSYRLRYCTTCV